MSAVRRSRRRLLLILFLLLAGFAISRWTVSAKSTEPRAPLISTNKLTEEQLSSDIDRKTLVTEQQLPLIEEDAVVLDERLISSDQADADAPDKPKRFDHRQIFSLTTRDRKYFSIFFGGETAYNPNIVPHPTKHDMWIVVAQHEQNNENVATSEQLTCTAGFLNGVLVCDAEPSAAPISPSRPGQCEGDIAYFNFRNGPRDARVFYGPDAPYIVYGSQSGYTCLGLWLQDARMLLDGFRLERYMLIKYFKQSTEVRRPAPWKGVEKNYALFWDSAGRTYAHYDLWPNRVFAQIDADGTVSGGDLAPAVAEKDAICMAKFMPSVSPRQESIHQATNTLLVTMCQRKDPGCVPSHKNTFIMHIYHHKTYYDFHGVYEPHVILFERDVPFGIHGISLRPFWIHGRSALTKFTGSIQYKDREEWIPEGHTEMFYVTSMSWKTHGQRYHGYIDDILLIAFGIEDTRSGAIDVIVGDLLQDLAFC